MRSKFEKRTDKHYTVYCTGMAALCCDLKLILVAMKEEKTFINPN